MSEPGALTTIVEDATCTGCGCLCDDIGLTASGGRIVEARRACELGRAWFLRDHGPGGRPSATIEGRPADPAEAIARAAEILAGSRAPLVLGLTRTTIEAQAAAVALADRIGAAIVPTHAAEAMPGLLAYQRVGRVGASLGEVKGRADVVVFWGVDPVATHPRHWERYSVEPRGRFVPEGRAGRTVLVADADPTATAERADGFLAVRPEAQFEALWALRCLVNGVSLDAETVEAATGIGFDALRDWADRLRGARYGAFFSGPGLGRARGGPMNVEAALLLVRDLNAVTRFVALPMAGPGNPAGIEAVLTWQAGSPLGVDFGRGGPRPLPPSTDADSLLAGGEVDAALVVADDPTPALSAEARGRLAAIPSVILAPDATARVATVALATATYGIHATGTVARSDGAMLPLRPALKSDLPTDRDLLRMIEGHLPNRPGRT